MRFFLQDQVRAEHESVVYRLGSNGRQVLLLRHDGCQFERRGKRLFEHRFQGSDSSSVIPEQLGGALEMLPGGDGLAAGTGSATGLRFLDERYC